MLGDGRIQSGIKRSVKGTTKCDAVFTPSEDSAAASYFVATTQGDP
jgi:hypothetical protein